MWDLIGIDKIWYLIVAALATESATNLLTKSEFSSKFIKEPLFNRRSNKLCNFIHEILDCGYCTSVWASILPAFWYFDLISWFTPIIFILVIHRLSNVVHFIIDLIDEKRSRDF